MNQRLAHFLTRLYPRSWQDRYGEEFELLLRSESNSLRICANVVRSALAQYFIAANQSDQMQVAGSFRLIVKQPSAFAPLAMSFAALAVVLAHIAVAGVARQSDEGGVAHIWQLLIAGQLPVILFFAFKWLRKAPRQALRVIAVQAAALTASVLPVFLLRW